MNRRGLFEGILVSSVGIFCAIEGLRLTLYKDRHALYDMLGPGLYVLILSLGLTITGLVYIFLNYRKSRDIKKVTVNKENQIQVIKIMVVFVTYIFLIEIVGYLIATTYFFFLLLRIFGTKSLLKNIALTVVFTAAYYIVFIQVCNMIFPRGMLFR